MEERYELKEEEVNVYTAECGKIQEFCLQDCIDGSAWLSIESWLLYGKLVKLNPSDWKIRSLIKRQIMKIHIIWRKGYKWNEDFRDN